MLLSWLEVPRVAVSMFKESLLVRSYSVGLLHVIFRVRRIIRLFGEQIALSALTKFRSSSLGLFYRLHVPARRR